MQKPNRGKPKKFNIRWSKTGERVSVPELADIVGHTRQTVSKNLERPDAPQNCVLPDFLVWYLHTRHKGGDTGDVNSVGEIKTRLLLLEEQELIEKVRGRRLQNMKELGEAVNFEDAQRAFDGLLVSLKTNLLAIPERVARQVASYYRLKATPATLDKVAQLVEVEVNKHLEQVSDFEVEIDEVNLDVDGGQ